MEACETNKYNLSPGAIPTYNQYFEYLMSHAKKLENSVTDNSTSWKANTAVSDYMQPYSPSDEYFEDAADLSNFMAHQGANVNMIQDVLQCNKALKQAKPFPLARTC